MSRPSRFSGKKKLGSYPSVSVIFSITLALFAIGVFGALVIYSKELEQVVKANVRVQVFLNSNLNASARQRVQTQIIQKQITPPTRTDAVQFISKEEAEKQFVRETGENFRQLLGDNPLHDAFLVAIREEWQSPEKLAQLKKDLEKAPGVFEVYYQENLISSINKNITQIGLVVMGLVAVLLIIVVLLIHNTLRLALFSQRFLIRSMQLVGAKRWFIQRPFLVRALINGMVAGIVASGLLIGLLAFATDRIVELKMIENDDRLMLLMGSLMALGMFVAIVSSYRAVNKYLKLSLDELY